MGMLQTVIIVIDLTLVLALREWEAPESILIQCGMNTCDIWTHYCHHVREVCNPCSPDVCNQALGPGGRPVQCYFYCMDVKERMNMTVLEDGTSSIQLTTHPTSTTTPVHKAPPEDGWDSAYVTPDTVVMVVVPLVTFLVGIGTGIMIFKCRKKGNKDKFNNQPPQGSYSGTTDPQNAVELAISTKLLNNNAA